MFSFSEIQLPLLMGSTVFLFLFCAVLLVFSKLKVRSRIMSAESLTAKVLRQEKMRKDEVAKFVRGLCGYEGEILNSAVIDIIRKEKQFYQALISIYTDHSASAIENLDMYVTLLLSPYKDLKVEGVTVKDDARLQAALTKNDELHIKLAALEAKLGGSESGDEAGGEESIEEEVAKAESEPEAATEEVTEAESEPEAATEEVAEAESESEAVTEEAAEAEPEPEAATEEVAEAEPEPEESVEETAEQVATEEEEFGDAEVSAEFDDDSGDDDSGASDVSEEEQKKIA